MSIKEFNQDDYDIIARDYANLMESARKRCMNEAEIDLIHKSFEFANEAHKGVRRRSGEPYILHPIAVAKIVVNNIGLGYKSIIAAILHDVVEDTNYTVEDIARHFGTKVASLVDGLTKIKIVLDKEEPISMQAENFKRILLTLNEDVRVVLIKLADRLHNCRTIEFMPEHKREKILSETMYVFIPLAYRLGLYEVKSEMEDIWLRYKEPEIFNDITARTNKSLSDKEAEIDEFIKPIHDKLKADNINFRIIKRVKSPYSIWNKMKSKNVDFDEIYDLYAVRIILDLKTSDYKEERKMCYEVFTSITDTYTYNQDRVRDWIKRPKNNGYEALHCTVMSNTGIWIEVQIRTKRMNDIAEKGIAAHWSYKRGGYIGEKESEMEVWLSKIKGILENPDVNSLELLDIIHKDLTAKDIFVYTPKGEQRRISKGYTALDFAYSIHTDIGNTSIAAKINTKLVPLSQELKTGDQIEIITTANGKPKQEWLKFTKSSGARNKISDFLSNERQTIIKEGKKIIEEKLNSIGETLNQKNTNLLIKAYEILENNADELFFRIGSGLINLDQISDRLKKENNKDKGWKFPKLWGGVPSKKEEYIISDNNNSKYNYVIASCCKPIPGDNVIGFISSDRLITVHKKTCNKANSIAAKHGDRIVKPEWQKEGNMAFLVKLRLHGVDRIGIINEITRYISFIMSINIKKITIETIDNVFEGNIELYVQNTKDLTKLINKLSKIDGVTSVNRIDL